MDFKDMTNEQMEARRAEIATAVDTDGADLDALETEIRGINAEIERRRNEEAKRAEIRSAVAAGNGDTIEKFEIEERENTMENIEIRNSAEYVNAYANYIRSGEDTECRALLTTMASGSVPVPELVENTVRTAWDRDGIMARVKKSYLKGIVKVGFEKSATGAVVHTEGAAAPDEETLVLGIVSLTPASIKKWISVSDEALDTNGEKFLEYIYSEVSYQIAKKAADDLVNAISTAPATATATAVGVPSITAATIAAATIATAISQLSDEATDPVIIMNKQTYAAFKAVQYANGYAVDVFEGLPVLFNNSMKSFSAATTGNVYAIVGDLAHGAQANFPNGETIGIKYDEMSLAEKDLVKIVGREFVGMGLVSDKQFCTIKK